MKQKFNILFILFLLYSYSGFNFLISQHKDKNPGKEKILSTIRILPEEYNNKIKIVNIDINKFPEVSLIINLPQEYFDEIDNSRLQLFQNGNKQSILSIEPISSQNTIPIDFVFVLDKTGSMSDVISNVKRNIKNFVSNILNKGIDYQFSLITFSDIIDSTYQFTGNIDRFIDYVSPVTARGGGDTLENSLEALRKAYSLKFRENAKKIVILLTDALFHTKDRTGNGQTDLVLYDVIEISQNKNINTYCVVPNYFREYDTLSLFTGGKSYNITDNFNSILDNIGYEVTKYFAVKYRYKDSVLPDNLTFCLIDKLKKDTIVNQKSKIIDINKKIIFDSHILFDFNKSELRNEFCTDLDRLIQLMKMRPGIEIIVNGHSDDIGTEEYNYLLSKERALSVKNYLTQKGISDNRVYIKGYGKSNPIAPNDTEEGRQLNRRIEIVIVKK